MAAYYMNEMVVDLPEIGLLDRTIYDIDGHLPNGDVIGALIVREPVPPGKTLRAAVDEHLRREATRLAGYAVLGDREAEIAGQPAIEVCSRWRAGQALFYTREAHVAHGGERLVITMTTIFGQRAACDEHIEQITGTLRLRDIG